MCFWSDSMSLQMSRVHLNFHLHRATDRYQHQFLEIGSLCSSLDPSTSLSNKKCFVRRHQPKLHLVLDVDVCNLIESHALFANRPLDSMPLRQSITCSAFSEPSSVDVRGSNSKAQSSRPSPSRELPPCTTRECSVELLSFSGPLIKPMLMTRVSAALSSPIDAHASRCVRDNPMYFHCFVTHALLFMFQLLSR